MSPQEMQTILEFLVAKLPEEQLAELDAVLEGGKGAKTAMDSAIGDVERREFMRIGPHARMAIRRSRQRRIAQDEAPQSYAERFPHSDRLGSAA